MMLLGALVGMANGKGLRSQGQNSVHRGKIMTVLGPISSQSTGIMLPHEHVMSRFGADPEDRPLYDTSKLFDAVVPYLRKLKGLGCGTIADCTAAYFGRAPGILREVSKRTGIHILTNTGYYAAANDRYVPPHAYTESAEDLARRWIREWEEGIEGSGIRPGFIKIGVDSGPLSAIDAKIVRAAALTHQQTGLTIAAHTGGNPDCVSQQLGILREEGVHPSAWIWVHANKVASPDQLLPAAEAGAWIELDGVKPNTLERHLAMLQALRAGGFGAQVLLSHDGNSFRYGGSPPNLSEAIFTHFVPLLRSKGFSEEGLRTLLQQNPATAFAVHVRSL